MTSIAVIAALSPFEWAITATVLAVLAPAFVRAIWGRRRRVAADGHIDTLLAEPLQPGVSRICPKCLTWHALEFVRSYPSELQGEISIYRCYRCHAETEFAAHHPPHAI